MLPPLREELTLHPGLPTREGAPTWALHDPVRNAFFSLDWLSFEVLCRWDLGDPDAIVAAIDAETTIVAERDDVKDVLRFLVDNELICNPTEQGTRWYREQATKRETSLATWILHHYLFFRLPLCRPDRWLRSMLPLVEPLFSRGFLWLTLAALIGGIMEISRQWETFVTTLVDTFSPQGLAGFLIALVFAKLLHELGHAFTAKRYGCRVPTMGVAFLVLFPVAYTDVTEVWRLNNRGQRLAVGAAGIRTELLLAAWATALWTVVPDGLIRSGLFMLATTTWITTVLVNASPFMRFDGYFLLMDWLGVSNLHQRSFALARWRLREVLFGLGDEPPEALPRRLRHGLILFAAVTGIYRLVVFSGIAVLVYSMAPKPIGPLLGAIELWWFILQPVWKEFAVWGRNAARILAARRVVVLIAAFAVLITAGVVPWDRRIHSQGLLRPTNYYSVYAPDGARIVKMPIVGGNVVGKDDVLFELEAPDLAYRQRLKTVQAMTASWQTNAAGVNADLRGQLPLIQATRARLEAELAGMISEKSRYQIKAPSAGVFLLSDPGIQPDVWIKKKEAIASIADLSSWQVITYLPEGEITRLSVGDLAVFYPEQSGIDRVSLKVDFIDQDAARVLPEGILASTSGGKTLVRETAGGLVPETALYRVVLSLAEPKQSPQPMLQRGDVVVFGDSKPLADDFLKSAIGLFVREAGF
ncbi:secretion protein HylD [Azospirillum melinis]|uniref:Secretion protein HylD n=1 Tax=Azospirillum melinis TaxID=328839 RepID=A0ABX2KKB0_9PROT|nr:site-2 protease family protein [Azospirillum melinis]MBP2306293.1 putative peptide zinc metalloprotease protein [Azospirillum melinis]NUB00234.1 secretion protein HylD [Azospirillum melinis]